MLLEIAEREMAPDITVVELAGTLELGRESQRIETLVDDLVKRGSTRVIFDMKGVEHMDSTGLGTLVRLYVSARSAGCALQLFNIGKPIRQLLGITHLLSVFEVIGNNNIRCG